MKKTKMEKGITLIALIITIVVLLILAVVTIGAIKNSKIITHSQKASNDYTVAQEKEQIQLALSEWQLQKNTSGNTQTFKNVMESELSNNATVGGEDNGPLTIVMKKTQNRYKVLNDGTITEIAKLTGTPLEKYIFGEDLLGRNFNEIYNYRENTFINEDLTIPDASSSIELITYAGYCFGEVSKNMYEWIYINYNNKIYKFLTAYDKVGNTCSDYGIIEIEAEGARVGKIVEYDEILWTILYDDETNGLQMICDEDYYYYFSLDDYTNSSYYNKDFWNKLDKTSEEFKFADLDKSGEIDKEIEKSIYIYNNAVEILNTVCEEIVPQNKNIIDVRCVGSNPSNKNEENTERFTSELLESMPINNSEIKTGALNGIMKKTSSYALLDYDRLVAIGDELEQEVFYAARYIESFGNEIEFGIYRMGNTLEAYCNCMIIDGSGLYQEWQDYQDLLRPVVKLKSDVQFNGSGTEEDPYTFAE